MNLSRASFTESVKHMCIGPSIASKKENKARINAASVKAKAAVSASASSIKKIEHVEQCELKLVQSLREATSTAYIREYELEDLRNQYRRGDLY